MNIRTISIALALLATITLGFAAKPESTGPDPDAILKNLYKAHAAQKGPFDDKENLKALGQYFTKELAALIRKDAIESKGEVGAYGFDPLYESQDPEIKNFKIGKVQWGGILKREDDEPEDGLAVVVVTFTDNGKRRTMPFRFQQQADKSWKIADINYSDGSTLAGLIRDAYK